MKDKEYFLLQMLSFHLDEIEGTNSISAASSEGIAQSSWTGGHVSAVIQCYL